MKGKLSYQIIFTSFIKGKLFFLNPWKWPTEPQGSTKHNIVVAIAQDLSY